MDNYNVSKSLSARTCAIVNYIYREHRVPFVSIFVYATTKKSSSQWKPLGNNVPSDTKYAYIRNTNVRALEKPEYNAPWNLDQQRATNNQGTKTTIERLSINYFLVHRKCVQCRLKRFNSPSNSPGRYWEVRENRSVHALTQHSETRESAPHLFCPVKATIARDFYDSGATKSLFVRLFEIILTCSKTSILSMNSRLSLESLSMKIVKPSFVRSALKIKDIYQILNCEKDTLFWLLILLLILRNLFDY